MTLPRMARMDADKTKLIGSVSATISEIRGEFWTRREPVSVTFVSFCKSPKQSVRWHDSVLSVPSCKNFHSRAFAFFSISFCPVPA